MAATVQIHTDILSPYGWTARHVAAEKGVSYDVVPVDVSTEAHRRLHPFGKMPILVHDGRVVYETLAIAHYLDRMFDGPPLQPENPLAQTDMLRWISIANGYAFPVMNGLVKERSAGAWRDTPSDEDALAAMREPLALQLRLIDEAVSAQPFLAGDNLSLADSFLFPQLHFAAYTPEGVEALSHAPAAQRWLERLRERPSFAATNPFQV